MQLKTGILFLILISFSGKAQDILDKKIDFKIENLGIPEAILSLSKIAEVDISFSNKFFDPNHKISLKVKDEKVGIILQKIISGKGLAFKLVGSQIVVYKRKGQVLSGFIIDQESGESLFSASIFDGAQKRGVLSNEYGFFSLNLKEDISEIEISFVGYEPLTLHIVKGDKISNLKIPLWPRKELDEVVLKANNSDSKLSIQNLDNSIDIQQKLIKTSPALAGGEDYLRGAQLLAGVNSGIDGLGGLQVRGGDQGQNLLLLDGVTVFIPYHLLGVFSIYNPDMVSTAKLMKGSFPARYGGRVSSVFDVRTREGNQYEWQGMASANLVNSSALVEGPIQKGKGALLFASRYSPGAGLFNSFFKNTIIQNEEVQLKTNFLDANLKLNYILGKKDRIYLSVFHGLDNFSNSHMEENSESAEENETNFDWTNTIASFRWNHLYNDRLFSNTTLTGSFFGFSLTSFELIEPIDPLEENEFFLYSNFSETRDLGINTDFDYFLNSRHQLRLGLGYSHSIYNLELSYFDDEDSETQNLEEINVSVLDSLAVPESRLAQNVHFYLEDQFTINEKWQTSIGIRFSGFFSESKSFFNPEPRLLISYSPEKNKRWHWSGSRMVQYIHLISSAALRLPSDLWIPSDEDLDPQNLWQSEIGYSQEFGPKWNFSSALYYKNMDGLYAYVDSLNFLQELDEDSTSSFLTRGGGQVFGLETSLSYTSPKNGFILSYTLSKSERQFETHNLGKSYAHDFDQRHRWKLFVFQNVKKVQLSMNWVYFSPNPQIGYINMEGGEISRIELNDLGSKNKLRSEAYHRMDISCSYIYRRKKAEHRFKIGVFNVYNHENIALYETENIENFGLKSFPIASLGILPSFNYSVKF